MARTNKLVNFDQAFSEYARAWFEENKDRYDNVEAMEADMPEVYLRWLDEPQVFLKGVAPNRYFMGRYSAVESVELLVEYVRANVPVPDPLMDEIVRLGHDSVQPLTLILRNTGDEALRISAVNLLREIDDGLSPELLLGLIEHTQSRDEVAETAAEALKYMGQEVAEPLLEALGRGVSDYAATCLMDVLSQLQHDERTYRWLTHYFLGGQDIPLYAALLGQYADPRAVPMLLQAIAEPELSYIEYATVKMAIEQLGGTVDTDLERDYTGDPAYEAMKSLGE